MPTNDLAPESSRPESALRCRRPSPTDGASLWSLARTVGLDENSPYAYVMWGDYFSGSSVLAESDDGRLAGFVLGFRPPEDATTLFVWQVGVAEHARGCGLAAAMIDGLVADTCPRFVEATVTPTNEASISLFRGLGRRHGADVHEEIAYPEELFPGGHAAEIRFRIGPLATLRPIAGPQTHRPPRGDSQ